MLDTQKRGRVAIATAVAGGSLAAVTIGAFASSGTSNAAYNPACGFGYDATYGYGYGYGACPSSPAPSSPAPASPSPTSVPAPVCNPLGKQHTPDVQLDGGKIYKGQRKGITARCLRPNRIVKIFVVEKGKTRFLTQVVVNKFGTVRLFYKATIKGSLVISFSGAQFDGKILRKKFYSLVR
jgi:hypothetical protein